MNIRDTTKYTTILNNSRHNNYMFLNVWPLETTCSYYISYNNKNNQNEHTGHYTTSTD